MNPLFVTLIQDSIGDHTGFVARCPEFNLVAQGKTEQLAKESFRRVLKSYLWLKQPEPRLSPDAIPMPYIVWTNKN